MVAKRLDGVSGNHRPLRTHLARGLDLFQRWEERRRERRHLARLDDRLLRDIGLSAADVQSEIDKPFWRE